MNEHLPRLIKRLKEYLLMLETDEESIPIYLDIEFFCGARLCSTCELDPYNKTSIVTKECVVWGLLSRRRIHRKSDAERYCMVTEAIAELEAMS